MYSFRDPETVMFRDVSAVFILDLANQGYSSNSIRSILGNCVRSDLHRPLFGPDTPMGPTGLIINLLGLWE
jgi:hypothetical protein